MSIIELLSLLRSRQVLVSLEDGKLKTVAPKGAITEELAGLIRARKDQLVAFLERAAQQGDIDTPIVRAEPAAHYPLSFSQQRLWFIDRLQGDSRQYNLSMGLKLNGRLDRGALQRSLDALVARHQVLRTRFVEIDDQPVQVIAPAAPLALAEDDLSALPEHEREPAVLRLLGEAADRPFDLARDPMIRGSLVVLGENRHALLLVMHHIASDGWSIGVLVRELGALYAAFSQDPSQDAADPLPPLPVQYADYAVWQRQRASEQDQVAFWREHLGGAPTVIELPGDRPRPPIQGHAGGSVRFRLPAPLSAQLRGLSQRHGTTLFMTLLAGWSALLSRLSGQAEVVVGSAVANRQRHEIEPLIGFFVNTLALRVRLDQNPSVRELLAQVRQTTLDAFAHQDLPFEQVVEVLQPPRSLAHSPLFQVMITLNNTPDGGALALPGLTLESLNKPHAASHFDLSLSLNEAGAEITGALEYASDLFDASTVQGWVEHYQTLLAAMAADEDAAVATLPLLGEAERQHVLVDFNDTRVDYPREACIQQVFEAQAARRADAVAVEHDGVALTYAQLNERANQVAHRLLALGMRPDDRVGLCAERGIELIVGMLGILKAGGAYVPLDPGYPDERLGFLLRDSAPKALLGSGEALSRMRALSDLPGFALDDPAGFADQPSHNPDAAALGLGSRHLAYVIYTSGSTGEPKGVMVEHRNVLRLAVNNHFAPLGDEDCVAHCANPAFDASTWEVWGALLNGARVLAIAPSVVLDPAQLNAALIEGKVTALWLTVGLFNEYAEALAPAFARLDHLLIGGDALDPRSVARALSREQRPKRLVNGYGPTETTTFAITHEIALADTEGLSIPIGRPIANTSIYLLDAHGQPVPVGVSGEIHIGGDGVARGYLNQPALTEERFIADPYGEEPDACLYKTGDLGRWRADGTIEYLGRNDFQVKIRGFRIELGEIESRLAACEGVRETVVLARADDGGDKRLVAYLIAEEGRELSVSDLRAQLAGQLPDYMLPSAFVVLDAMPLTANGKLDRKALPAPEFDATAARGFEAPSTATEIRLAEVWARVLKHDRIGRDSDFFELGGHSLLAARVVGDIARTFDKPVPVRALFERSVLRHLAEYLDQQEHEAYQPILPAPRDERGSPLSFAQQRLWFLDQLDHAAGAAYHIPTALRLSGELDRAALRAALDRIVVRHESLRTRFVAHEGAPLQVIDERVDSFALVEQDLRHLDEAARKRAVETISAEEAQGEFDLAAGPLIRGRLLLLAEREHVLLVTQHHIVSDGWSIGVLVQEVSALYAAFSQGRPDPLPPLPLQYADYAIWQRQRTTLHDQVEFWRGHLADAPALLELPTDRPRPATQSYLGGNLRFRLPAGLSAGLHKLAQRNGATLFMTLLAGWSALLSRLSAQDDVVIGSVVANRQRSEIEPLIGFFVNTLALRVRLHERPDTRQLLAQIRQTTLDAYGHQGVPFEQVVEAVQPVRSLSHSPVFQVMLTLNNTPDGDALELPGLTLETLQAPHVSTQFDLALSLNESGEEIAGGLEYASDLFDPATLRRWLGHYRNLLQAMVDDDTRAVADLDLLGADERVRVLETFNAGDAARDESPAEDTSFHALFERQVERSPDADAAWYMGVTLSYDELNRRANRIAHRLASLGVGPGARVAICMERGVGMIAAVLGVLKAGAAYVPLDLSHPEERLAFQIDDSAPAALLSQYTLLEAGWIVQAQASGLPVLAIDQEDDWQAFADTNPQGGDAPADQLAYVIYTSGSTGRPKGVMVEHRSVVNLWRSFERTVFADLPAQAKVALDAGLSFDASVQSLVQLLSGRCLMIVPSQMRADGESLARFIASNAIDVYDCTPAQFELIAAHGVLDGEAYQRHPLHTVLIGGEAISLRAWNAAAASAVRCYNVYGPTECTVDASIARIEAGVAPHIGRAIDRTRLYVLDGRGHPVPVGIAGEIHIAGAGLARGYLNQAELTAERFVRDPFQAIGPNGDPPRMYRTGDLGRWRDDGCLEYLGRNDQQVKIRGFRIELGEIETRLRACDGVRDAVVLVHENQDGDDEGGAVKRLVAYLAADDDGVLVPRLKAELARSLPGYMMPAAFVVMAQLPLTGNGKVDRHRLREPDPRDDSGGNSYVAPSNEVEAQLAAIWQQLLRVERVGVHDNFFEIGGDSILTIQVVSRANQAGIGITTKQLFEAQTIAELAQLALSGVRIKAPQGMANGALNLLPIHHAFLESDPVDRHHFNQSVLLETPAGFDQATLQAVIEAVYRRHDALRLRFSERGGRWQAVHAPWDAAMLAASCVLETLPAAVEARAEFVSARCNHWQAAFDLAAGPLLRAVHFQAPAGEGGGRLLLAVHHAVVDGVSWRVLLADIEQAYGQHASGQAIALEAKTSSFQQWGDALAAYADSAALRAEKPYWLAQATQPVAALPVDRDAGLGEVSSTRSVVAYLDAEETRALQQQCNGAYRTQINELLLTGVYLGMREWTGAPGLRLRLEGHGRDAMFDTLDLTQTVGWFTSVYPLTLTSDARDIGTVVKAVKEQYRAIPQNGIGYGVLRYLAGDAELAAALEACGEPELEFNYLGQFDQVLNEDTRFQVASESAGMDASPRRQRLSQLGLSGMIFAGQLRLSLDYSQGQYDEATAQRALGLMLDGLRRVIAHCRQADIGAYTPSDFPLARVDQARLDEWQDRHPDLQRLYPATPMQAGLQFHSLLDASAYVVQTYPVLRGELDPAAFRAAWQQVLDRHDIFRTAFVGEGEALHQLVLSRVELPWHEEDWSDLSDEEQTRRFEAFRHQDHQAGFDFDRPPLLRIALFRLGEDRYRLLWTQHHILLDGWSMPLVYRDVMQLYRAQLQDGAAPLPPPPSYERYIGWLQGQSPEQAHAHWRDLLGGFDAPTPLVVDRLPGDGESGYSELHLELSLAQTQALQALAKAHRTTVNILVQWSWAYLLHRYSGESEVVFGATISGRPAEVPGVEEMVGLFINTIPVKVAFGEELDIAGSLATLHDSFQRSAEHGHLSLVDIQRHSGVRTGISLFDSLLAFENYPLDAMDEAVATPDAERLTMENIGNTEQTNYKLSLSAALDQLLRVRLGYRGEDFARATAERLLGHLRRVLVQLPDAVDWNVRPEPLDDAERAALAAWNDTRADYDRHACIHDLFEARVAQAPDAIAVVDEHRRLSYAELNAQANVLARDLIARGVGPGALVGLHVDRSWNLLLGVLAVLKAGGAYVPLDPDLPRDRLVYMLEDAAPMVVLSTQPAELPWPPERVLALPADPARLGDADAVANIDKASIGLTATNPAYVIYTSGSTGRPKGVVLEHGALVNLALAHAQDYGLDADSRVLQFSSFSFDAATWDWARTLSHGGSLYLCDDATRRSGERLGDYLIAHDISHAFLPPAVLALIDSGRDYPLRSLIIGGEAWDDRLAWEWAGKCALFNAYGPTESTVVASQSRVRPGEPVTIGHPLPNLQLHILDRHGDELPIGVPGELAIAGVGLARGYLNQPELTAERFVRGGSGSSRGQRVYRSGDLARRLPSGEVEFLGRLDDQVKIRGLRIELGEIESQLLDHPDVHEAVVLARRENDVARLVAYVVRPSGRDAAADEAQDEAALAREWRQHLKRTLPDYMVPAAFVVMTRFPLNLSGKVDKQRLPAPSYQTLNTYVAPSNEVETRLAEIWQQLLRVERIGVHDNFFEIGGDSILTIQVVSRANQAGIGITTRQLFEAQTIAELARLASSGVRVKAPQGEVAGGLALLPIQRAFFDTQTVDRHHFNQSVLLETPAGFDQATLQAVIEAVYRRHDALRLRFSEHEGRWQAVHAPWDAAMLAASCVLEPLPAAAAERAAFIGARCNHWQAAFDLATGPLLRAVHFQAPAGEAGGRLLLVVHHAVVDGVSWRVLLADIEQAYGQRAAGQAIALEAKTSSFQQWGEALADYAGSEALRAQKPYWLAQSARPVAPLPVDREAELGEVSSTRSLAVHLDVEETRALQQQCHGAYRTQINELLLSGVYLGMREWTGAPDLRLSLEGHGRDAMFDTLDLTQTVGWFTSVYPLTLSSDALDVGEVIKAVKEQYRAIPHNGIGYGVLRHLSADADLLAAIQANGEPELEFNYLGQFDQVLNADTRFQAAAEPAGMEASPRRKRLSQLSVGGMIFAGQLRLSLDYGSGQYDEATARTLLERMLDGLRRVIAHCRQPGVGAYTPSDFPLARVDQPRLDEWQGRHPQLQRLYPATPMQAGLQFHSLLDASAYVVQTYPVLRGELDPAAFRAAWQQVLDRHDIFRTAFVGEGEDLHQLVLSQIELPWHEEDWSALDEDEQERRFEAFRQRDHQAGFDFERPPLLRISLFRLGEDRYRLLWTQHHILLDGWSMPLVYRDVMRLYRAQLEGREIVLPPTPSYERYIGWLQGRSPGQAHAHWRELLGEFDAPTPLMIDRPALAGVHGHRDQWLELSPEQTQALQALAKTHRTTINILVQWSWAYLLHRYSGESEVVFGATISGRPAEVPGIEEMVGLFINTIPVKVGFEEGVSIGASLSALHESFQRSAEYGHLSLTEIQRQSRVRTGTSLFDSLLAFENYPLDAMDEDGGAAGSATPERLGIERAGNNEHSNYKLGFIATVERSLRLRCGYRAEFFEDAAIERLLGHLRAVLEQLPAAAAQGRPIELVDQAQRRQLIEWGSARAPFPDQVCVHRLFEDCARRSPDAIAIMYGEQRISYRELDDKATRLARYLVEAGIEVESRVGLYLERSPELLIAVLGVMKAGATYVPLEPGLPAERIRFLLDDAGIQCVLLHSQSLGRVSLGGMDMVLMDEAGSDPGWLDDYAGGDGIDSAVRPSNLVYVLYTSGSTGQPKAVMISHRSLSNYLAHAVEAYLPGVAGAVVSSPLAFDATLTSLLTPLVAGKPVLLLPDDATVLEVLSERLFDEGPGWLFKITPAHLDALGYLDRGDSQGLAAHRLVIGGEQLSTATLRRWKRDLLPNASFVNEYGPTETVVGCSVFTVDSAAGLDAIAGSAVPIGRPIANTRLYVLDPGMRWQPVGSVGELYIGGAGVARGYLGRDELTRARFIADPFIAEPSVVDPSVAAGSPDPSADGEDGAGEARLYRTGDLVRWLPDGELEFIGRRDQQIKIRGFRIELGEIEQQLAGLPGVAAAAVIARPDGNGDAQLLAYAVPESWPDEEAGRAARIAEYREALAARLPAYMQPNGWMLLPALPLSGNGKVDRKALPTPDAPSHVAITPAETPTEQAVAALWEQLLRLERIDVNASFFELGGHSLLVVRMISELRAQIGIDLVIHNVFEHPNVRSLARYIDERRELAALKDDLALDIADSDEQELIEL